MNGLNSPIKRLRLSEDKMAIPNDILCTIKTDTEEFKVKAQEKTYHVKTNHKKAGVAKLISGKTECMTITNNKN